MEMSRENVQKSKESPYKQKSRDKDKKNAYIGNEMQLKNHS